MVVLSTLCRATRLNNVYNKTYLCKLFQSKQQNAFKQVVRKMSEEKRIFHITPTRFHYTKFKDDLHFFVSIGVVPLGLLILYCNIFIGPATLTEIPEDYEPEYWEYYKHPISRFISRYFHTDPQVLHEQVLHALHEEKERLDWRETIDKAKDLMLRRDDYIGWNYIPSGQGKHIRYSRKMIDDLDVARGFK